jgi:hypothetical protein
MKTTEKVDVWSPVRDDKVKTTLGDSPIWKQAYHKDEVTPEIREKHNNWFVYTFVFDGLKVRQLSNFKVV